MGGLPHGCFSRSLRNPCASPFETPLLLAPQLLRSLGQQAGCQRLIIITKRFSLPPYKVPPQIAAAVKAPYQLLRDLVVIEHPNAHVIDKILMDLVCWRGGVLVGG
jgi:hypothetical protein